jgi:hypothetical protein
MPGEYRFGECKVVAVEIGSIPSGTGRGVSLPPKAVSWKKTPCRPRKFRRLREFQDTAGLNSIVEREKLFASARRFGVPHLRACVKTCAMAVLTK